MDSSGKGMSHGPAPLSQPGHLVWLRVTRFGLAQTNRCHDPDPAVPSICPDPTLQKRNIACLALIFTFCIKTRKIYQTDPLIYLQVLAKIS